MTNHRKSASGDSDDTQAKSLAGTVTEAAILKLLLSLQHILANVLLMKVKEP